MSASDKARLNDILDDFDDAMLINHVADGGFQARPMHIAERTAFPHLSFVTAADAAKLDALSRDDRVAVTLQGGGRYVALSGTAVTSADPVRLAAVWNKAMDVWFARGPGGGEAALIDVTVTSAEYWDMTGRNRLRFIVEAGKAVLANASLDPAALSGHGTVDTAARQR